MSNRAALEKKLSYRLPIGPGGVSAALESAAEHWKDFRWEAGRYIAEWTSPQHGSVQVWGVTHAEAQSVVRHALAHMGADEDAGEWILSESKNPRFGKVATVQAAIAAVRESSSGVAPFIDLVPNSG